MNNGYMNTWHNPIHIFFFCVATDRIRRTTQMDLQGSAAWTLQYRSHCHLSQRNQLNMDYMLILFFWFFFFFAFSEYISFSTRLWRTYWPNAVGRFAILRPFGWPIYQTLLLRFRGACQAAYNPNPLVFSTRS